MQKLKTFRTFFLSGPLKQLKKMFEPTRLVATLVFLAMIVLTLVAGLILRNPVLALICIIAQYLAMAWYSLSYIPYARYLFIRSFPFMYFWIFLKEKVIFKNYKWRKTESTVCSSNFCLRTQSRHPPSLSLLYCISWKVAKKWCFLLHIALKWLII